MAGDDIVQRIIIQAVDQASAVIDKVKASGQQISGSFQQLGQQLGQVFTPATSAIAKFGQSTATSFAQATASIAALGSTAPEALANATAAAQKFGASAQELQAVQSVISSLSARVRDGGKSFTELATNVDKARGSVAPLAGATTAAASSVNIFSRAFSAISSGVSGAVSALRNFGSEITANHGQIRTLEAAFSQLVPGFGSLISLVGRAGASFGALAAGITAIVAATTAADAATVSAAKNARALSDLAEAAGQSRERLSALQQVFRESGVSSDQFNSSIGNLLSKMRSAAPQLAADWAEAADKIKTALLNVQSAMLQVQQTKLDASNLQLQTQQIALQGQQLQLQAATFAGQKQGLQLQGAQLQNNLASVRLQLQYSGQLNDIAQRQAAATTDDAAANLRILLLKRQLRDGNISEEEFAQKMAEEDDAALNRAIRKARIDLDAAKLNEEILPQKQALEQQALEIQAQQLQLQLQMLPIQQRQLQLAQQQNALDQQKNKNEGAQNLLDIQRNIIQQQRDQVALNQATLNLQKEQANNLQKLVDKITEALKAGQSLKDIKFDPLTTDDAKTKAILQVLQDMKDKGLEVQETLGKLFDKMPKLEAIDLGKQLGLGPEFMRVLTEIGDKIKEVTDKAVEMKIGFSEADFQKLEGALKTWEAFTGAVVNAKDELGAFNAAAAASDFKILKSGLDAATGSAEGLATALKALGAIGGESQSGQGIEGALFGKGGISGFWDTLKGNINRIIPSGGILDLLGTALISSAGAAELEDPLKKAIVEPVQKAIEEASKLDASKVADPFKGLADQVAQQFSDLGDKIREAIGSINLADTFAQLVPAITQAFAGVGEAIAQSLIEPLQSVQTAIADLANGIVQTITTAMEQLQAAVAAAVQNIIDQVQQALQAIQAAKAAAQGGGGGDGGGGGGGGLARGGMVWGPGSSTSDSILAMLSRGEYVVRAAAVEKYGVGLLNMINSLAFPGFRMGGLALPQMRTAGIPAFASGGLNRAGGSRILNLTINGETFRGMSAPEQVAQQLERAAISRQASSTGVKPRWTR